MTTHIDFDQASMLENCVKELINFCYHLIKSGGPGRNQVVCISREFDCELAYLLNNSSIAKSYGLEADFIYNTTSMMLLCKLFESYDDEQYGESLAGPIRKILERFVEHDSTFGDCAKKMGYDCNWAELETSLAELFERYVKSWWRSQV